MGRINNFYDLRQKAFEDRVRSQKAGHRKRILSEQFWAKENVRAQFPGPPTTWRQTLPATARTWGNGLKPKESHILEGLIAGGNNNPLLKQRLMRK